MSAREPRWRDAWWPTWWAVVLALLAAWMAQPMAAHDARTAVVRGVYDCDTIQVTLELGFGLYLDGAIRVRGISAPEVRGPEKAHGLMCRARTVAKWLKLGDRISVLGAEPDKYSGRWVATVWLPDGRDLGAALLRGGWALPWSGDGPRPAFLATDPYPLPMGP